MWFIDLHCDGCGERLPQFGPSDGDDADLPTRDEAIDHALEQLPEGLPEYIRQSMAQAEACRIRTRIVASWRGWEQVDAPEDAEKWYCPQCRLALDRETLVADVTADS